MNNSQTTRRVTGTVTTELNRYGAMTLRSENDRTYQIVDCAAPDVAEELERLRVGETVTLTLTAAPCRGNGWQATGVDANSRTDTRLVA
jgi:hypothetical protein